MNRSDQADFIKSKHSSQNNHYTEAFSYLSVNDSNVYSVGQNYINQIKESKIEG